MPTVSQGQVTIARWNQKETEAKSLIGDIAKPGVMSHGLAEARGLVYTVKESEVEEKYCRFVSYQPLLFRIRPLLLRIRFLFNL